MLSLRTRRTLIWKRTKYNWPVNQICSHFRINKDTFYYHWNNYLEKGWQGLEIKSRRPNTIHRTLPAVVDKILNIRRQYNYGPNKIEAELRRHDNISISHTTIHKILIKHRLNNPLDNPRRTWGKNRFERDHSNSMWQTDFMMTEDDEWMVTFLDDHSRFIVGCRINEDATGENAIKLLEESIKGFGKPKQVLSDRGAQFVNPRGGITEFTQFCINNEIQHIMCSKRRPTTIGKVERWHKTYQEESQISLEEFVNYYNYKRLHQSLGYLTPAEVYFRDMSDM